MLVRSIALLVTIGVIGFVFLSDFRSQSEPSFDPASDSIEPSRATTTAVVATDALNVRAGASLDATVIDTLPRGARLEVVGDARNGFTPIRHGADQAWMASEFLSVDDRPGATDSRTRQGIVPESVAAIASEETWQPDWPVDDVNVPDPPAAVVGGQERWIDVDRTTGVVTLHEGASTMMAFVGKTGRDPSVDGFFSTALGTFHVFSMNEELAETPFAEGVYLTDWVGFDPERSNGFHSPARDASGNVQTFQNATTMGCVRLDEDAAEAVFDFSFIGMRVEIHD